MNTSTTSFPEADPVKGSITMGIRAAVVLALVGIVIAICLNTPNINIPSEGGVVMKLPETVGSFVGKEMEITPVEKAILPPDTQFARMNYKNFKGEEVNCQIVLSGGEKRSIHRPEVCLPGQGWTKKSAEVVDVKLDDGRVLPVMKLVIARPIEVQPGVRKELTGLFLYWFVGKNSTTPYHWQRIMRSDLDRVFHNVNHRWAYVIVNANVLDGFVPGAKNQAETLDMLKKFIGDIAPEILKPEVQLKK